MGVHFNTEVAISDIIAGLSYISLVIGGVFAFVKWNASVKVRRAEYIDKLYSKRSDDRIRKVLYMFDYTEGWYDRLKDDDELEIKIDDTLSFYSYICYLKNKKLLKDDEFNFFRYDIERILSNKGVMRYFNDLNGLAAGGKIPSCYRDLIEYGRFMKQ